MLATLTSDVTCKSCSTGVDYADKANLPSCQPVSACGIGKGEVTPPSTVADRICEDCRAGVSFSGETSSNACQPVRTCEAGQQEETAPTAANDRLVLLAKGKGSWDATLVIFDWKGSCSSDHDDFFTGVHHYHSYRICQTCPSNTFKPNAGNEPCTSATQCSSLDQETTVLTTTSDRACTATHKCTRGVDNTGEPCECPGGESCESCYVQPAYDQVLLVSSGSVPRSDPVYPATTCVDTAASAASPTAADFRNACRDLCNETATCDSFYVFVRSANDKLQGDCCMTKE